MSNTTPNPSRPFGFPLDLERHIFEMAALSRPAGIPTLMLVAWRVKSWQVCCLTGGTISDWIQGRAASVSHFSSRCTHSRGTSTMQQGRIGHDCSHQMGVVRTQSLRVLLGARPFYLHQHRKPLAWRSGRWFPRSITPYPTAQTSLLPSRGGVRIDADQPRLVFYRHAHGALRRTRLSDRAECAGWLPTSHSLGVQQRTMHPVLSTYPRHMHIPPRPCHS
jgi:hypothetical protein